MPEGAAQPPCSHAHHPFILEYKVEFSGNKRQRHGRELPAHVIEADEAKRAYREILAVLGVISRAEPFAYTSRQSWFVPIADEEPSTQSTWGQEDYWPGPIDLGGNEFSHPHSRKCPVIPANDYYDFHCRHIGNELEWPDCASDLLDRYKNLPPTAQQKFLSACSLFNQGTSLWADNPSISFAAFVSALESLVAYDHRAEKVARCVECGQERHRVSRKFQDFFAKYGFRDESFRTFVQKVYRFRSKILHAGELFHGDVHPDELGSEEWIASNEFRRQTSRATRICMVNWLSAVQVERSNLTSP